MKATTNTIYPAFALFVLACFAFSPQARATCQDACLTNNNTVQGDDALISLTTGTDNTAIGFNALFSNTSGGGNTAIGNQALFSNTDGVGNTATGNQALLLNTTGCCNTANGLGALAINSTGFENTATGYDALGTNEIGLYNTAVGFSALLDNLRGVSNTAVGWLALSHTGGSNNIGVGASAGSNLRPGSYNIDIGNDGQRSDSQTIRVGHTQTATFIAGISGATVPTGVAVIVDSSGHLGTTTSSARYKESIRPMDKASEAILALKPVIFRYKHELDANCTPQFGLVAEDVENVNPDLVARDEQGKPYTVRYEAVNAMLLNEFLKEHHTVQELKKELADLTATVKEQASQIQKVRTQIEMNKSAPKAVAANW